jgi:hypothetical protein
MIALLIGNRLCERDYAALEGTCTCLREAWLPANERLLVVAARAAAARLLRSWRPEAVQAVLFGRCGKRALRFAAAATEGRRCSIAAGAAHTLALPRQMRDAPAAECAIGLSSVGGDWTETFHGSLLRLWVGQSAAVEPGCESQVFAYGTFSHGDGELRGEVRLGLAGLPMISGIWRQHGAELGQGKFELCLSPCGRRLVGSASSHTGWSGAWAASRVGVHVGGVWPSAAAGCYPAGASLAVAGANPDGRCGQLNGRRGSLQPAGPPGLSLNARLASAHAAATHSALLCTDGTLFLSGSNRYQALGQSRDAAGCADCAPQQSLRQWMHFVSVQHSAAGASGAGVSASTAAPGSAAALSLAIAAADTATRALEEAFANAFAQIAEQATQIAEQQQATQLTEQQQSTQAAEQQQAAQMVEQATQLSEQQQATRLAEQATQLAEQQQATRLAEQATQLAEQATQIAEQQQSTQAAEQQQARQIAEQQASQIAATGRTQLRGMLAAFYQYINDDMHVHTPAAGANLPPTDSNQPPTDTPPARNFCRWTAVPWPGGAKVIVSRVAVGERHTVAVAEDGALWSWGCNEFGQTGDTRGLAQHGPVKQTVLRCGGEFAHDGGWSHKRWWGAGKGQWLAADVAAGREHSLLLTRSGEVTLAAATCKPLLRTAPPLFQPRPCPC